MPDDLVVRGLVAGLGVAAIAAPIGCFVVWRRMAYFGDTLAHSGLLGVALAFSLNIDMTLGVIAVAVVVALVLAGFNLRRFLPVDTLLGILSHTALAAGLIAASALADVRFDLMSLLFGDILAVSNTDFLWIFAGGAAALLAFGWLWRPLLALSVHEEIALSEGVPVKWVRAGFLVLIAFVVAIAMKIVGVLLITALLVIPAAAARPFARSPEAMAVLAFCAAGIALMIGLAGAVWFDAPAGPAIVIAMTGLFVAVFVVHNWRLRYQETASR